MRRDRNDPNLPKYKEIADRAMEARTLSDNTFAGKAANYKCGGNIMFSILIPPLALLFIPLAVLGIKKKKAALARGRELAQQAEQYRQQCSEIIAKI